MIIPARATPATAQMAPMIRASVLARATAWAGSRLAAISGNMAAAIIGPSAESGPTTRIRDGPNTA